MTDAGDPIPDSAGLWPAVLSASIAFGTGVGAPATLFASRIERLTRRDFAVLLGNLAMMWPLKSSGQTSSAPIEDPAEAAARFYREYMGMGVALRPLWDRWLTARFQGVLDAFYGSNNSTEKVKEGDPFLPWKNWEAPWRSKLKAEQLNASGDRAQVLVTLATDATGQPLARLVHLVRSGSAWRIDDVTDAPR